MRQHLKTPLSLDFWQRSRKPLIGPLQVNKGHSLAQGLVSFVLFRGPGDFVDLVQPLPWQNVGLLWSAGKLGKCAQATGTQYAWVTQNPSSAFGQPKAGMCAAMTTSVNTGGWPTIISKTASIFPATGFQLPGDGTILAMEYNGGTFAASSSAIASGVPFHAVGNFVSVVDRRLYLNGVKTTDTTNAGTYIGSLDRLAIGTIIITTDASFQPWNGDLYYAAWWNRSLSDDEAYSLYANPFQMLEPTYPAMLSPGIIAGNTAIDTRCAIVLP